ncbi:hypothetical protein [Aliiroseovarius sp. YM-037]|uniref:hypothetical protein n=1 Tax=Aliiroseovarius sp. YM-037 TaxID=3341728 RepID=UPI003A812D73
MKPTGIIPRTLIAAFNTLPIWFAWTHPDMPFREMVMGFFAGAALAIAIFGIRQLIVYAAGITGAAIGYLVQLYLVGANA